MTGSGNKHTPISNFGKFGLISHITEKALLLNKSTVKGIGDDAAIIDSSGNLTVVSTDLLLEGIHFNLMYSPLKHLGYKAVIRAISDIYAMNGTPCQILVALGVGSRFSVEQIDEIYEGIYLACSNYGIDLVGGDITSSLTGLTIGMTSVGLVERELLVTRNGARPNDLICVTGNFGASYMGLQILERERKLFEKEREFKPDLGGYEYIIGRQLKPEFPAKIPLELKENNIFPTSMIDVSDCLASDLLHICKLSDTGCRIYSGKIPVDAETCKAAEEFNLDPLIPVLNGGEDYELLFTVPLEDADKIRNISDIRLIGHMTLPDQGHHIVSDEGVEIELKAQGWERSAE